MPPLEEPKKIFSSIIFTRPIVSFALLLGFLIFFYFLFLSPPRNFPKGQTIKITAGSSLRAISLNLKENNIIKSRVAFETIVIILGGEKHLAFGDYLLKNKISVFEIARRMSKAEYQVDIVKITIPEGLNALEIASLLSSKLPNFNKENFLTEAVEKEGYLFPDTYFFYYTANEKDVLKYMNDNFEKKILSVKDDINASGKDIKDIIIMASIIEKEAKGDADREIISGILWNRILKGMPLQVDAAPITYKERGLPDMPIANPGLASIKASINPLNSPYFYYLHDKDGNIHYAKTFEEHKKNIVKYLK